MLKNFFEIQNGNFSASEKNKVNNVNLKIKEQGEIISLLGPSGIGKTTILRTIAGLQKLSKGVITLKGKTLSSDKIHIEPRVLIDNTMSNNHTLIEVTAKDRAGLLHIISKGLSDFGLTIVTAHVSTYGERAVDVFYVKDRFGFKVSNRRLITKLRRRLLELVSNSPINKGATA